MELTCKTEYALLALIELTDRYPQGEPLQIREIAARQNIPDRYLEQLLATLRRGGLVISQRGAKGGYLLAREPWKITMLDAIDCLEGSDLSTTKRDSNNKTVENLVVGEVWQEVCDSARKVLQSYTLQDLRDRRNTKSQIDIMYYI
ncbi:RrF2 family transcriptional regulator [Oscillatoria salina]|uniref:RrF2 family transcriptional regulator n=1 Tax=Oscillatoria salina TaxID=331517 RepID=UPI0013BA5CCE|nr:Rrf2 family transcriptional regulator [Oscillatoria salina]MBZ8183196.1 Rrf2 family transcriptional regulator [Oscillatoria salina IIICB1]NET91067.1 Rrf2 family transcriptional regulator [Kamptonema sp. SIO1D9]